MDLNKDIYIDLALGKIKSLQEENLLLNTLLVQANETITKQNKLLEEKDNEE